MRKCVKKSTCGWLLIILAMMLLTACGESKKPEEQRPGKKPTATPTTVADVTPTAEATPTEVPDITPTPEETPTPTIPQEKPKVAAQAGPLYITGKVFYTSGQTYGFAGEGNLYAEQMYLVEDGYLELMHQVTESNFRALRELIGFNAKSVEAKSAGEEVDEWFFTSRYDVVRSDSVLFSYRQKCTYFDGEKVKELSWGSTFDTTTGEPVQLRSLVTDYDQFKTLVLGAVEELWGSMISEARWKEYVSGALDSDSINWMATSTGILIWFPEGYLLDEQYHEPALEIRIEDYPTLFAAAYIGNYDGSLSMRRFDYENSRTKTYNRIAADLIRGIGSMSETQVKGILAQAGIETDDEGIEAGFLFYDPDDSSRCYEVLFDSTDRGRILRSVSIGRCVVHAEEKDGRYVPQYYVYVPESSSRTGKNLYGYFENADILSQMEFGFVRYYTINGENLR